MKVKQVAIFDLSNREAQLVLGVLDRWFPGWLKNDESVSGADVVDLLTNVFEALEERIQKTKGR